MTIPHAAPGQLLDLRPLGSELRNTRTAALLKTPQLEVIRLVLPAGTEIPSHRAPEAITVHCLEGRVAFISLGKTQELSSGQLLYLPAGVEHAVRGLEDASVLVTLQLSDRPLAGSGAKTAS
jgi:quercetin dioxygenase-like cupin family protein